AVLDAHHPFGAHPVAPPVAGHAPRGRRLPQLLASERLEPEVDGVVAKPGADLAAQPQRAGVVVGGEDQAPELARLVALLPADDHEVALALALDLHPGLAAFRAWPIRGALLFGDHALEVVLAAEGEEGASVALEVVEGAHRAALRHEIGEQRLALDERERRQITALELEEVEHHEGHRDLE